MKLGEVIYRTGQLKDDMRQLVPERCLDTSRRAKASAAACNLSLEHWDACRHLIENEFITSAVALHRCQFEAVVRSAWIWFAATDAEIDRVTGPFNEDGVQAAKNLAGLQEMISDIGRSGPQAVYLQLNRFREAALKPINSYVHAGLHPIRRAVTGYPEEFIVQIYRNVNSVASLSWMQIGTIEGKVEFVGRLASVLKAHAECLSSIEQGTL